MPTTTICPACRASMRTADTFCWTCGGLREAAPDRLEVVHHPGSSPTSDGGHPSRNRTRRIIAVFAVALVAAVGTATWWLLRPTDSTTTAEAGTGAAASPDAVRTPTQTDGVPTPSQTTPAAPFPTGVLTPSRVTAPSTSPTSTDAAGRATSYQAANVLDADPRTAWRTEGDASGSTLSFAFDEPVRITQVGLINGFAKIDPHDGSDRYEQGRRILSVTWTFDTPTGPVEVQQELRDGDRELQLLPVAAVEAGSVELTITSVTRPGAGGGFDRTAISDVEFTNV